ncbi:hypothetical protein IAT38_006567 [Cryptococcus sp. DSM 104549]
MTLLSGAIQPPLLTLLNSISSPSLSPLFTTTTDPSSSSSTIAVILDTDTTSTAGPSRLVPRTHRSGSILHPVVHIQSSDPRDTYIQAGCSLLESRRRRGEMTMASGEGNAPLGVELQWLGLQLRALGKRGVSFEVGVVDIGGREGVIRCSSFKKEPTSYPHRSPPLIHLPLALPNSTSQLTSWSHIHINLAALIPLFRSLPRPQAESEAQDSARKRRKVETADLPSAGLKSVSYVRVYANCRVRRIWFSAEGEPTLEGMGRNVEEEWALYAAGEAGSSF